MANQKIQLTQKSVDRIRREHMPGTRLRVWDREQKGFFLRITKAGSAAYCVRVKRAHGTGKADYTLLGADEAPPLIARQMAQEELLRARKGEADPVTRRREETNQLAQSERETFAALAEMFMSAPEKMPPQLSPRTYDERRRLLSVHILPRIGNEPFVSLQRKDVREAVRAIQATAAKHPRARKDGTPGAKLANECHGLIKCIFNWAQFEDMTEANPAVFPKLFPDTPQKRSQMPLEALTEAFQILNGEGRGKATALIIKLHAVTLQRPHAITKAHADQFDWTPGQETWCIPANVSKTNERYDVPLSALAVKLFREAFEIGRSCWAFPNASGDGPIRHDAAKQRWIRIRAKAVEEATREGRISPLEGVVLYDCRRLGRTLMVHELGVSERVAEACISHAEGRADSTRYDVAPIEEIKRKAMEVWASKLFRVVLYWF